MRGVGQNDYLIQFKRYNIQLYIVIPAPSYHGSTGMQLQLRQQHGSGQVQGVLVYDLPAYVSQHHSLITIIAFLL